MQIVNRSIVITDPCYIAKDEDWDDEGAWNYVDKSISSEEITDYIWEDTGVGDGKWTVYEISGFETEESFIKFIKNLVRNGNERKDLLFSGYPYNEVGKIASDSGCMGVFIRSEAYQYNPDWEKDLPKTCYTKLSKYTGQVDYFYDDEDCLHIYGFCKNGTSFFTI